MAAQPARPHRKSLLVGAFGPGAPASHNQDWDSDYEEAIAVMWHDDDSWGMAGWLSAGLAMLVLWTIVIAAVVLVTRSVHGRGTAGEHVVSTGEVSPTAQRILDERFARGELSEYDYQQQRAVLSAR